MPSQKDPPDQQDHQSRSEGMEIALSLSTQDEHAVESPPQEGQGLAVDGLLTGPAVPVSRWMNAKKLHFLLEMT